MALLAGIYIPKKSSASAALEDSGLKGGPGKNLLAVVKEGRPRRRHSMSADPAHLARIVAAAAAATEENSAREKVKGHRSSPLFPPRRPSLLPRSPYSVTDSGDSAAQGPRLEPSAWSRNPEPNFWVRFGQF